MEEHQRKLLLERVDREGATVGHTIPESVTLGDDEFALQAFVFETKKQDRIDEEHHNRVDEVRRTLRRARNNRMERIEEEEDLEIEEAEELADEIIGIERALNALSDLSSTEVEAEMKRQEAADTKRWLNFVEDALDTDIDNNRIQ